MKQPVGRISQLAQPKPEEKKEETISLLDLMDEISGKNRQPGVSKHLPPWLSPFPLKTIWAMPLQATGVRPGATPAPAPMVPPAADETPRQPPPPAQDMGATKVQPRVAFPGQTQLEPPTTPPSERTTQILQWPQRPGDFSPGTGGAAATFPPISPYSAHPP